MASVPFSDWVSNIKGRKPNGPGCSPLERLPAELLHRVLLYAAARASSRGWNQPHALPCEIPYTTAGILPCLFVSRHLHDIALPVIYRRPDFKSRDGSAVSAFFDALQRNQHLGNLIRTLNTTAFERREFAVINDNLSLIPSLRQLRLPLSHIEDIQMLHRLFFAIPALESLAIGINGSADQVEMLRGALTDLPVGLISNLASLAFSNTNETASSYIPGVLESLLPRLPNLRMLDLSQMSITCEALTSIPSSARLTHLSFQGCTISELNTLVDFLATHPAVKDSLVMLNLGCISDLAPLSEEQVNTILLHLPPTLLSLDLSSSQMGSSNIPHFQRLCSQLEELTLGRGLRMQDVETMLLKPMYDFDDEYRERDTSYELSKEERRHEAVLAPMRNAIALCKLRQRLNSVVLAPHRPTSTRPLSLRYLNIGCLSGDEQGLVKQSVLLGKDTASLRVVELDEMERDEGRVLGRICGAVGWKTSGEARRSWVERM